MKKMIIRSKTFRQWFAANLKEYASDIASNGADAGFPGITYYSDTIALYEKFHAEIWEMVREDAESMGQSPTEFIAGFRCTIEDNDTLANALVWYAAERIAQEY